MNKFCVTLADLRKHGACYEGYNRVVRSLQGKPFSEEDKIRNSYLQSNNKQQISLISIVESNGLDDALWATRCLIGEDRNLRLYAVWCARQVQHLISDTISLKALDVAEAFANGNASLEELRAARAAAWDAARAAAWAAARNAAWAAARNAAGAAAGAAAWAAAGDTAWDAAWAAAREAAWDAQKEMFIKMCKGQAPWQHITEEI